MPARPGQLRPTWPILGSPSAIAGKLRTAGDEDEEADPPAGGRRLWWRRGGWVGCAACAGCWKRCVLGRIVPPAPLAHPYCSMMLRLSSFVPHPLFCFFRWTPRVPSSNRSKRQPSIHPPVTPWARWAATRTTLRSASGVELAPDLERDSSNRPDLGRVGRTLVSSGQTWSGNRKNRCELERSSPEHRQR